jgi:hypothetical protein
MERWSVGVPEELLPSDGATLAFGGVRLSWSPCEKATTYCLQLAQSPRFDDDVIEVETVLSRGLSNIAVPRARITIGEYAQGVEQQWGSGRQCRDSP